MLSFLRTKIKKLGYSVFRFSIGKKIRDLLSKGHDETILNHLEQLFFEADLGVQLSLDLVEKVRSLTKKNPSLSTDDILHTIYEELLSICTTTTKENPSTTSPYVVMVVGVNGSGKTTSIAKLAYKYKKEGKKVMVVAADTFRAAAVEQLEFWAKKIGVECVKSQTGADPSAVVHDALSSALVKKIDIVIVDTAGRLHTKIDLMQELQKVRKVCTKLVENAPHETLLVVDASIGQNALDQAQTFHKYTPLTSLALTKLDGSAKGGIVIALQQNLHIPVKWVGIGENLEDLTPFDAQNFLYALLSLEK